MASPPDIAHLLAELIEKPGVLTRDIEREHDAARYEARIARVDQKLSALAERLARKDAALAKALRTAWTLPARSLARNAATAGPQPSVAGSDGSPACATPGGVEGGRVLGLVVFPEVHDRH